MSRIGKKPIPIPQGVQVELSGSDMSVKGPKGQLAMSIMDQVNVSVSDDAISVAPRDPSKTSRSRWGMQRTLISNLMEGVTSGYQKKLLINGVGYRAQAKGKVLNLSLGFSHPVEYELPEGVTAVTPSQTEIVINGSDKQKVGQVAAEIRAFRPPEPYKGKGVRYAGEEIVRKEAKKK